MKDFLERLESIADQKFDEMNIDGEHFKCCCGDVAKWSEANQISPNPYSEPVCQKCFEEWVKEALGHEKVQR